MTIKEIIQKLHTAITDACLQESHFESWLTLNEGIIDAIDALKALDKQEPVAMKFKIYKPTVPDPLRQDINNALLPWVYDQDRNSGFDATMWVTPVATLPPQRKPLTDEQINDIAKNYALNNPTTPLHFARDIEAAHGIKE